MNIPENAVRSGESSLTKDDHIVISLVRYNGVLLCADFRCPSATDAVGPHAVGWALIDGWWYCPNHWTTS